MTTSAPRPRPVGRDPELGALTDALSEAAQGGGGAVLLQGPAGIGKSCLLHHVLDTVPSAWHVTRLCGTPLESRSPAPFGTLGSLRVTSPGGTAAPTAALAACLTGAAREGDRRGVTVVSARLFRQLCDAAPTVLALDDLAHTDPDTLALVARVARTRARHPLVITGAWRGPGASPAGPLDAFLDQFDRAPALRVIDLAPLDTEGVRTLVAGALGRPPSATLTAYAHDRAGGNPYLVLQTLEDLRENGRLRRTGEHLEVTGAATVMRAERCRQVVGRSVGSDPGAVRVARAAAALRTVPLDHVDLLARVCGLSRDETEAALDVLIACGVLTADGTARHAFAQPVVRDALYQQLGPAARRRAHGLAADWLHGRPGPPDASCDIAVHIAGSATYGDPRAIEILAAEARRAFSRSPGAAVAWYRKALTLTPPDHVRYGDLVTRLTLSQLVDGRLTDAVRTAGRTAERAASGSTGGARLSSLVIGALIEHAAFDEAAALADTARETCDSLVLHAQAAHLRLMTGRPREAATTAEEAEARLESADVTDRITAMAFLAPVRFLTGPYRRLGPFTRRLRDAASQAPPAARLDALSSLSLLHSVQGDTHACAAALAEADPLLATSGWHIFRGRLVAARVHHAALTGAWDDAFDRITRAARGMKESGALVHLGMLRMIEATLLAHRGDWNAARRAANAIHRAHGPLGTASVVAHAEIDLLQGDQDSSRRRLSRWLAEPAVPGHLRARLLVRLADVEAESGRAASVAALLAESHDSGMDAHDHIGFTEARLAHGRATGDHDALLAALAEAERHDLALLRGRVLLALGAAGADAEHHLHAALDVFHTLGALPWCRKVGTELRRRSLKVPRRRAAPSHRLTAAETEIARHVQLGRSNREIAQAVSLSVKTVERHLSRVYAKTGCAGRVQLVRALDGGLLDGPGNGPA
ncbi:AAA family ATPase [Streptomyces sp. NPDC059866]|uniref:helix-turn-helix transcriptional regulator n=1 Tax=Streptomyces sp. NPDC059866 TaxID=3346978 RepID=UPI00365C4E13